MRLSWQPHPDAGKQFTDVSYMEKQIKQMAKYPDIEIKLAAIDRKFAIEEFDGLKELWVIGIERGQIYFLNLNRLNRF